MSEIITVEDLLSKMRQGTKADHNVSIRALHLKMRVLSIDEMNSIRRDAYMSAVASKGDDIDKNVITQKAVLELASTFDGVPYLSKKFLSMATTDEISCLYDEYINVVDSVNPSLETISDEQFKQLVNDLKKNIISAKDLSIRQLKAICSSYVDLISQKDS